MPGGIKVKGIDEQHALSHVNATARKALYQPNKDKPIDNGNTTLSWWGVRNWKTFSNKKALGGDGQNLTDLINLINLIT